MRTIAAILLALAFEASAQTSNVTPSGVSWFDAITEVDIRLKGPAPTDPLPTVRLISKMKFAPLDAKAFIFSIQCWNATKSCPPVIAVTVQVYLNIPGTPMRRNVTSYTGLCGTQDECILPIFPALAANVGESYRFHYSVAKASWVEPPSIVVK